jgi:hypothetical protein
MATWSARARCFDAPLAQAAQNGFAALMLACQEGHVD